MRAVVQRVTTASVSVDGVVVGRLDRPGLVVLVGVRRGDTPEAAAALARKLFTLRILRDDRSVAEAGAHLLVVSQFTLYGDVRKGRRPSWQEAAPADHAEPLVQAVIDWLREHGAVVASGQFGATMQLSLVNDGPLTLLVET